jgi:hypothetical protein
MSGTPLENTPFTVTSSAFSAPSVVVASSVRLLPGCAFRLRARPSPSSTSAAAEPEVSTWPARISRNGPLTANSLSGSTPVPSITVDLSPLLMSPLNTTRGSTWRTSGSASSAWRMATWSSRPCCSGVSSSWLNCAGVPSTRWPLARAAAWASDS